MLDTLPADVLPILQAYSENCREDLACTAPKEIDRQQWVEALEILPPDCWERRGSFESFQCSERFRGAHHCNLPSARHALLDLPGPARHGHRSHH